MRQSRIPLLAAAALALAGCGGGETEERSAFEIVAQSASATGEAGSARLAASFAFDAEGEQHEFAIEGALDLETQNGVMTMDLAQLGLPGAAEGTVEVRLVDQVVYFDFSAMAQSNEVQGLELPEGVRWLKFDPVALAEQFGGDAGELTSSGTDPASFGDMFEVLRGVSSEVEELGTDEVRGEATTHYRVEIDPKKAVGELPREQRDEARQNFGVFGDLTFPAEVWVDEEGRVRRMTMKIDSAAMASEDVPAGAEVEMTMEFYDFGVEVEVEAPPEDETADFLEVMLGALGNLGDADAA